MPSPAPAPSDGDRLLVVYAGLLLSMTAFSTDAILPVLPRIAAGLSIDIAAVQLAVPCYMFGFGLGQLLFGPLSDRLGRRPALLWGLLTFLAGTALCLLAGDLPALLLGRFIQGMGGGAGQTVARAMLRDRFVGPALAQNMAAAAAIFAIGPMLAPLAGVGLAELGAWRAVFAGMALFGLGMLVMALMLRETHTAPDCDALAPARWLANAKTVWRQPQSRYFLLLSGFVFTAIVTFLASMPRLFDEALGATPWQFALAFALASSGIVLGQLANRRLIRAGGALPAMQIGALVLCLAAGGMLVLHWANGLSPLTLGLVMFVFNTGYLVVFTNALSLTLDPHGRIAGFTASVVGFAGPLIGASLGSLAIGFVGSDPVRWALVELTIGVLVTLALMHWRRRHRPHIDPS